MVIVLSRAINYGLTESTSVAFTETDEIMVLKVANFDLY